MQQNYTQSLFLLEANGCQLVVHVEFLTEYQCDSMFKDIIIQPSMYLFTSCQLQASVERWCNIILMSSVVFGSLVITGCF
jgi:hypothetical protein